MQQNEKAISMTYASICRFLVAIALLASVVFQAHTQDEPPKKRAKKGAKVVAPSGENRATPVERLKVAKGFKAELLYSVPGTAQGSWINLGLDPKGRLYVSDQYG